MILLTRSAYLLDFVPVMRVSTILYYIPINNSKYQVSILYFIGRTIPSHTQLRVRGLRFTRILTCGKLIVVIL